MTSRDADAAKLAEKMGWDWVPEADTDTTSIPWDDGQGSGVFRILYPGVGSHEVDGFRFTMDTEDLIVVPLPDAPLHAHMEFVGRLAEALVGTPRSNTNLGVEFLAAVDYYMVSFDGQRASAPDLSHAAILAALAAKGGA